MKFLYKWFVLLVVLINCSSPQQNKGGNKVEMGNCSINLPSEWLIMDRELIDGAGYVIITKNKDSIFVESSFYANSMTEPNLDVIPKSYADQLPEEKLQGKRLVIIEDSILENGLDIDKLRKQNVSFVKIDRLNAKIVFPRVTGVGITGVYFDSTGYNSTIGTKKFNMYGINLDKEEQEQLLNVIHSLQFSEN